MRPDDAHENISAAASVVRFDSASLPDTSGQGNMLILDPGSAQSVLTTADSQDASTATPRFTPDVEGAYVLRLHVSDGAKRAADNVLEVAPIDRADTENGWTVLATTVGQEVCTDAEILQAYHEQHSTVEPGFRWIKNPAATTPVWLEKPERIAALALLTVVSLLVYALIQRQVRLYLQDHHQQLPGNKGRTTTPTAAVVLSLCTSVMLVQLGVANTPCLV
ncbi:MAG TPA: hypothetical protein VIH59_14425 [Candidatus Tectomicrobia bacterium]|jgi:hypothetical protein